MNGAIARIILRYGVGALVALGLLHDGFGSQLASDPDIVMLIEIGLPLAIGCLVEVWYWAVRRAGRV